MILREWVFWSKIPNRNFNNWLYYSLLLLLVYLALYRHVSIMQQYEVFLNECALNPFKYSNCPQGQQGLNFSLSGLSTSDNLVFEVEKIEVDYAWAEFGKGFLIGLFLVLSVYYLVKLIIDYTKVYKVSDSINPEVIKNANANVT